MRPVAVAELKPGQVLRGGLYSPFGAKLVPPGGVLSEGVLASLKRGKQPLVLVGEDGEDPIGAALDALSGDLPLPGAAEVKVASGVSGEATRGMTSAITGGGDPAGSERSKRLARERAAMRREAEALLERKRERWFGRPARVKPLTSGTSKSGTAGTATWSGRGLSRTERDAMRGERVAIVHRLYARLGRGERIDIGAAMDLVDELIDLSGRHGATLAAMALEQPEQTDYLPGHAYASAVLAVGLTGRLGWGRRERRAAGLSALLADVGMMLVPAPVRGSPRRLDDVEANAVRRHPAFALAVLDRVHGLPDVVSQAVYQHHEREDGSGYPDGLRGEQIHDVAKVVACADVLAAATGGRAHRSRVDAHEALRKMLRASVGGPGRGGVSVNEEPGGGARRWAQWAARVGGVGSGGGWGVLGAGGDGEDRWGGLNRPTVRALVSLCGLYPVGMLVRLSDGTLGEVTGLTDATRPDRPRVRLWGGRSGDDAAEGDEIDLAVVGGASGRVLRVLGPAVESRGGGGDEGRWSSRDW